MAQTYGVLRDDGKTERAIFIVDKEGVIQYIDIHDIDDQPSNEVLFAELARIDPEIDLSASVEVDEELPSGGVVMYCNRWCPDCRKARNWFSANNIDYAEVDVTLNQKAADQVRAWADGNLVTPTFDLDGTVVVDYDPARLAEVLLGVAG